MRLLLSEGSRKGYSVYKYARLFPVCVFSLQMLMDCTSLDATAEEQERETDAGRGEEGERESSLSAPAQLFISQLSLFSTSAPPTELQQQRRMTVIVPFTTPATDIFPHSPELRKERSKEDSFFTPLSLSPPATMESQALDRLFLKKQSSQELPSSSEKPNHDPEQEEDEMTEENILCASSSLLSGLKEWNKYRLQKKLLRHQRRIEKEIEERDKFILAEAQEERLERISDQVKRSYRRSGFVPLLDELREESTSLSLYLSPSGLRLSAEDEQRTSKQLRQRRRMQRSMLVFQRTHCL